MQGRAVTTVSTSGATTTLAGVISGADCGDDERTVQCSGGWRWWFRVQIDGAAGVLGSTQMYVELKKLLSVLVDQVIYSVCYKLLEEEQEHL